MKLDSNLLKLDSKFLEFDSNYAAMGIVRFEYYILEKKFLYK